MYLTVLINKVILLHVWTVMVVTFNNIHGRCKYTIRNRITNMREKISYKRLKIYKTI
jgi:hypothetical protein